MLFYTISADGTGGGKIETPDDYGRPTAGWGKKGKHGFKLHLPVSLSVSLFYPMIWFYFCVWWLHFVKFFFKVCFASSFVSVNILCPTTFQYKCFSICLLQWQFFFSFYICVITSLFCSVLLFLFYSHDHILSGLLLCVAI